MDRNFYYSTRDADWVRSLSARRAWIEIISEVYANFDGLSLSARRAWIEIPDTRPRICGTLSLSARRAWIEIAISQKWTKRTTVALRKESVDRNMGLSSYTCGGYWSLSARRAWIEMRLVPAAWLSAGRRSPQGERG